MTGDMGPAIQLATYLRDRSLQVQIYGEQKKFKQKMSYADKLGVPYVVLLGEDEIKQGKYALKDMRSGEQKLLATEEVFREISTHAGAGGGAKPILDKGE